MLDIHRIVLDIIFIGFIYMLLIKTQRDALLAPLQSVSGIVEKKHTLPILSNVLLEKAGDKLTLLATDIEIHAREIIKTREQLNRIYAERTGQSYEKIAADMERDRYMSAQEALDYGFVDKIVTTPGTMNSDAVKGE